MDCETENLGFARVDVGRYARQGVAEVVYGEGKSAAQVAAILSTLDGHGQLPVLVTRLDADKAREVRARFGERFAYFEEARLGRLGDNRPDDGLGVVAVVCGGTSDLSVAEEAALTLEALGNRVRRIYDVGVAGIHRLLECSKEIEEAQVVVADLDVLQRLALQLLSQLWVLGDRSKLITFQHSLDVQSCSTA